MSVSMEDISKLVDAAVKDVIDNLKGEFNKSLASMKTELEALKAENSELKKRITEAERAVEKNEQYGRKTSLILGGDGVPLPKSDNETTSETRAVIAEVIKNKLNVEMQGTMVACHRLKNKKRVLVKFQNMEDREAVYQSRFDQPQDAKNKVVVHENLTETRANMIRLLGQMRERNLIVNYHTRNGNIYARSSRDNRYSLIEPWLTEQEIQHVVQSAKRKGPAAHDVLMRSQTLDNIQQGTVAGRVANLADYVVHNTRHQTRQQTQNKK